MKRTLLKDVFTRLEQNISLVDAQKISERKSYEFLNEKEGDKIKYSELMLKNIYHNFPIDGKKHKVKEHKIPLLLELTEIHIKDFSELVEKKLRSKETLKQWKATQKKISEFLKF